MSNCKISILGCGWLGKPLAESLMNNGYFVKVSTRSEEREQKLISEDKKVFRIKISSTDISGKITDFLDSDILIINIPPDRKEKQGGQFKTLLPLIESSIVKKVLFVSSTSVYPMLNRVVTEEDAENKNSPLFKSEQLFSGSQHFRTTVIRFAGLIGGPRHPGRFFSKSKLIKNCKSPVNLIHRTDCLRIISEIIEQNIWGEVFNACAGEHPERGSFYREAAKCINEELPECTEAENRQFKIISNEKVKKLLGFDFKYSVLTQLIKKENWN